MKKKKAKRLLAGYINHINSIGEACKVTDEEREASKNSSTATRIDVMAHNYYDDPLKFIDECQKDEDICKLMEGLEWTLHNIFNLFHEYKISNMQEEFDCMKMIEEEMEDELIKERKKLEKEEKKAAKKAAKKAEKKAAKKELLNNPIVQTAQQIIKDDKSPITDAEKVKKKLSKEVDKIASIVKNYVGRGTIISVSPADPEGTVFDLTIEDGRGKRSYAIDPCSIIPNLYSVTVTTTTGYIVAVPIITAAQTLLISIFQGAYALTDEDIEIIRKYYVTTQEGPGLRLDIYTNIDFSKMKVIAELSPENKEKLFMTLSEIFKANPTTDRFRFKNFKWIDDFELVSDDKVRKSIFNNTTISGATIKYKEGHCNIVGPAKEQAA